MKKHPTRQLLALGAFLLLGGAASVSQAAINLNVTGGQIQAYADDNSGSSSNPNANPTGGSTTLSATDGSAVSVMDYIYSNAGSQATFRMEYDTQILGVGDHYVQGYGYIDFTLSESVTYTISGQYSGSSTNSTDEYYLFSGLYNFGTSQYMGYETEYRAGSSAAFQIDGVAQGTSHGFQGSLTGALGPGTYRFYGQSQLHDNHQFVGTTTASGFTQLQLTGQVPEPASLIIYSLGGLGLAFAAARRRFRKAA